MNELVVFFLQILLVFGIVVFVYALALLIMNINIARSVERPYNNEPLSKPEVVIRSNCSFICTMIEDEHEFYSSEKRHKGPLKAVFLETETLL